MSGFPILPTSSSIILSCLHSALGSCPNLPLRLFVRTSRLPHFVLSAVWIGLTSLSLGQGLPWFRAFVCIGPLLWNDLPSATHSTILTGVLLLLSFVLNLFPQGCTHWECLRVGCTERGALEIFYIQYNKHN